MMLALGLGLLGSRSWDIKYTHYSLLPVTSVCASVTQQYCSFLFKSHSKQQAQSSLAVVHFATSKYYHFLLEKYSEKNTKCLGVMHNKAIFSYAAGENVRSPGQLLVNHIE